ncbi:helix-turn-helix transcriptional regulator [Herbiconiux sp. A18JL235]|uniref:Helix-turn-helix transcriptional regulator n=1 Tax=Herbiconiux sp. A18JL235 TaxID=3152363 RepID=A0AB39BFS2_9MICO
MKRAERLYALVDVLRRAVRPWSATRLAREFEVSTRTIERDIGSLQSAGVSVYADHGATGGYSILREYSLPPLKLTAAESLATLAGLALLDSSPYQAAARRARAKVAATVHHEDLAPVRELLRSIRVIDAVPPPDGAVPLGLLADVIAARRVVRLTYADNDDDGSPKVTVRDVETLGLLRAGESWLLAGWCRLRDAIRGFRIEQITHLEILDEVAPARDPGLWDADLARWPSRDLA